MELFCSCCLNSKEERTPLLANGNSVHYHHKANDNNLEPSGLPSEATKSSRIRRSGFTEWAAKNQAPSEPTVLIPRIVNVQPVDGKMKENFLLYNSHLWKRQNLIELLKKLSMFPGNKEENLSDTFNFIKLNSKDTNLKLQRKSKFLMEISFAGESIPYDLKEVVELFNETNEHIKYIMDNGEIVASSIKKIINEEKLLKRHILMASLGAEGPTCFKDCIENISDLTRSLVYIEHIKKDTEKDFETLKNASTTLFEKVS